MTIWLKVFLKIIKSDSPGQNTPTGIRFEGVTLSDSFKVGLTPKSAQGAPPKARAHLEALRLWYSH